MAENSKSGTRVMRANFHHAAVTGEQIHTHFVMTTLDAWKSMPESKSPLWQIVTHDGEILAVAVDVTRKTVPAVMPQSPHRVYTPSLN